MLLNTMPKELAEKLRPKIVKYPTHKEILMYCRSKLEEQRELLKAEVLHNPRRGGINSFVEEPRAAPSQPEAEIPSPTMADLAKMMSEQANIIAAFGERPGKGGGKGGRGGKGAPQKKNLFKK